MAYRDFKQKDLQEKFGIVTQIVPLFNGDKVMPASPSASLVLRLEEAALITLSTEKAVSEQIIAPVMMEVKRKFHDKIQVFSGEIINGNAALGLNGEIDFLITQTQNTIEPQMPILCVVEAKIGKLDKALPQAIAQMLGAQIFNQKNKEDESLSTLHGAVTDGDTWRFLRLEGKHLTIDSQKYYLVDMPLLLGVFSKIIESYF